MTVKQKDDLWTKCRLPVFYVVVLICLLLLYVLDMTQLDFRSIRFMPVKIDPNDGFVIKTTGCRIPSLDPFDKEILKFIYKPREFHCSQKPSLISSNISSLFVESSALPYYNIVYVNNLKCCYQPFWRVDTDKTVADNIYAYGHCKPFKNSVKINEEFVKVICTANNTIIYKDFHAFITQKKTNIIFERTIKKKPSDKLNVLMIGLDSISRLNFHRQMPKTVAYLKKELNAFELIGYNKVGDNTFPNLIPMLTGLSEEQLKHLCWKNVMHKFDDCPFIWKSFSESGYLTSFAEDSSWMGVFNYMKKGFNRQPTDYYWKTFNYIAEKEIGHKRYYNADLCLGTRPVYVVMLDYILKFVKSLGNKPYFSFFWGNSLSHDNLNFPSIGDDKYKLFFKDLKQTNLLEQTVLIVLSDHGIRWGEIRTTHQGQLEERLPFMFFIFPTWFNDKYTTAVANLKRNSRRLTTPFDIHETLLDILNLPNILPDNIKIRSKTDILKRGISLFLHIPENRTCLTAKIAAHWCTCQTSVEVNKNDSVVVEVANFIVTHINNLLDGYKECSELNLDKINDARLLKTDDYLNNNLTMYDYTLIIKTNPGGGVFEATVRYFLNQTNPFQLTGTISRINLYGNQSSCMTDFHLKLYCYCGS